MNILVRDWEVRPHNCHLDPNTGRPYSYLPACSSFVIPGVVGEPISKELADHLVKIQAQWLRREKE